jgi:hypothetical protein
VGKRRQFAGFLGRSENVTETGSCWCCGIELQNLTKDSWKPYICVDCSKGKHGKEESEADMFTVSIDCQDKDCKTYRYLRVSRHGTKKLFENRDQIKCKKCGKTKIDLKINKSFITETEAGEEIFLAKEWRGKTPAELVEMA